MVLRMKWEMEELTFEAEVTNMGLGGITSRW